MDAKFNELKLTFNGIKNIREEINSIFTNLEQRVAKLKELYKDFIDHNTTTLFIFGLDSFYFQNKLIDIEFSDMKKFYDLIMNRMYCEYYKLYKIILDYCHGNLCDDSKFIDSIRSKTEYPVYKDLEPYKRYEFSFIDELHDDITNTLIAANNYLNNKKHILESYRLRSNVGLNINNFVSTYEFEVTTIDSQISLFCSYVDFFHELHLKYLKRFITKIQILYGQVNHDIKFDEVSLSKKSDKKKYMNEMKNELDKDTMRAIRSSIHVEKSKDETSSDSEESKEEDEEVKQVNNRIQSIIDISDNMQKTISPLAVPHKDIPFMAMPLVNDEPAETTENPIVLGAEEPVCEDKAQEPIAQEPIVEEHIAQEPIVAEPIAEEAIVEEHIAAEPIAAEPNAKEPNSADPVIDENTDLIPEPSCEAPSDLIPEPSSEEAPGEKEGTDDWVDGFVTIQAKKKNKKKQKK